MILDISMPIVPGAVFRAGTTPVDISVGTFHSEVESAYESVVITMPAHVATHVDLVMRERRISPERMIGPGKLIDATAAGQLIDLESVQRQQDIHPGDFVLFRTDMSEVVGTPDYDDHPELSEEVVEWLIAAGVNAVGIDALGIGRGRLHGRYDRMLAEADILVIENLSNLRTLPPGDATVYCLPLSISDTDAIPARVLVSVD